MAVESKKWSNPHWGAWVWIKWKAGAPENVWDTWKQAKEVKGAWSVSGNWDCALWVDIDNPDAIERFVWREIRGNKWVESTETHWAKKVW